jgi:hypothetical protein
VFSLPWLRFVQGWLFSSLVGVTLIVGIAHFVWGGIQPQAPAFADKVDPAVRAHLSVLLGLIMLTKAWGYYLGRFDLLTSPRGVVEGASYTDVHAQLPALNFLAIVAVICAVLFLVNIRVRLWSLPVIAVGLLALVSVLLGTAYPASCSSSASSRRSNSARPLHSGQHHRDTQGLRLGQDRHLSTTRGPERVEPSARRERAHGVQHPPMAPVGALGELPVAAADPAVLRVQRRGRDRYDVSGSPRVLMVSGREISQSGIPAGAKRGRTHTWSTRTDTARSPHR